MFRKFLLHLVFTHALITREIVEHQNAAIYGQLKQLAESDYFSKIQMSFNEKCPRSVNKCSALSCQVKEMNFKDKSGVIDLLKTREAFSKTAAVGSREVWEDLYKHVEGSEQMQTLLSGLKFSINTHISAFYTKIFDFYFSNPRVFLQRFKGEYRDNFMLLYAVLRTAVANLINNPSEIDKEVLSLSYKIMEYNLETLSQRNAPVSYGATIPSLHPNISEQINIDNIFINSQSISILTDMVKLLACLNCQKCRLWGTIQLKGLRAAVKALNGMPLSKSDLIFLINSFRRLSVSVEESKWLEKVRFPVLWLPITYYYELFLIFFSICALTLAYYKTKKNKSF